MSGARRQYSAAIKRKVILCAETIRNCAAGRQFGVTEGSIRGWRKQLVLDWIKSVWCRRPGALLGIPVSARVGRLSLPPGRFREEVVARTPHRTHCHSRRNDIPAATARRLHQQAFQRLHQVLLPRVDEVRRPVSDSYRMADAGFSSGALWLDRGCVGQHPRGARQSLF